MKKLISLLCTVVLLLCVLAVPAGAAEVGQLFELPEQGVVESILVENKDNLDEYTISDPQEVRKVVKLLNDFRYISLSKVSDLNFWDARADLILTLKGDASSGFKDQSYPFTHNSIRVGDTQYYGQERYFSNLFEPISHSHVEYALGEGKLYLEQDKDSLIIIDSENLKGDVVIPDTIKGFPVVAIEYYTGPGPATVERQYGLQGNPDMTSVTFPATFKEFRTVDRDSIFSGCDSLKEVVFAGDSPESLVDSYYKPTDRYNFLCGAEYLERLVLPKKVKDFRTSRLPRLNEVVLDPSNPYFVKDEQGLIYNKDKTMLITAANGSADRTRLTIPSTVTEIAIGAFDSSSSLQKVYGGSNVRKAYETRFLGCPNLNPFEDTYGHWSEEYAKWAYQKDLFAGTSVFSFSPDDKITRGMLAAVLYRMEQRPEFTGGKIFPDIPGTSYYAKAVRWCSAQGIIAGYENGRFGPNDFITREQMACMLYRYAKLKGEVSPSGDLSVFTDADQTHSWAKEAMEWAVGEGIISGKGNDILDPQGTATRAEAAVVLKKISEE